MNGKFKTQVSDRLLQVVWLFENVLGKFSEDLAYNQRKELAKKTLCEVYWYTDIYTFIKPELDQESVNKFFNTVFTYYDNQEVWQSKKET